MLGGFALSTKCQPMTDTHKSKQRGTNRHTETDRERNKQRHRDKHRQKKTGLTGRGRNNSPVGNFRTDVCGFYNVTTGHPKQPRHPTLPEPTSLAPWRLRRESRFKGTEHRRQNRDLRVLSALANEERMEIEWRGAPKTR